MRPGRTITELLFALAVAITGRPGREVPARAGTVGSPGDAAHLGDRPPRRALRHPRPDRRLFGQLQATPRRTSG